jgi:hypothetical protein
LQTSICKARAENEELIVQLRVLTDELKLVKRDQDGERRETESTNADRCRFDALLRHRAMQIDGLTIKLNDICAMDGKAKAEIESL